MSLLQESRSPCALKTRAVHSFLAFALAAPQVFSHSEPDASTQCDVTAFIPMTAKNVRMHTPDRDMFALTLQLALKM